jgi:tetraacyldisaccharide 4'-kinase
VRLRRPPFWDERAPGLGQRALLAPLSLLAGLYASGAWLHRAWWERGPGRPVRLPCKVVSVGNLVVGGSGKTPVAAWVASALRRRGWPVAIASRGYGGRGADAVEVVSDGRHVLGRAEVAGEEPMLLAGLAPGVPVLVGRRRDTVGRRAVAGFNAQVLVLDDGFQHHRLAKDVELVTLTGAGLGNGFVLPRGPLREPLGALSRAHAILAVDGPLPEADATRIARIAPDAARFALERRPSWTRGLAGGERAPAFALAGQRVGMLCGIARPAALRDTLRALGAVVVAERSFPDHHRYRREDLAGLADEAALWITTEKDAGKLLPSWLGGARVRVLALETVFPDGEKFLDWLERRLHAHVGGRDATGLARPA